MKLALLALALVGCASGVKVVRYSAPPKLDPGVPGRMFVEVTGTATALPMIEPSLKRIAQSEMGFELVGERGEGVAVLKAEVERWWTDMMVPSSSTQGGRPPPTQTTEHLQLVVTLTKADGATLSESYQSTQNDMPRERQGGTGGSSMLAAANAREVLKQFAGDFAPASSSESLDFDDDSSTVAGLQLARNGDLPAAERAWRQVQSASAHYNVGALLEARGAREEALVEYEAAAALSTDPKYARAVEAVKKSLSLVRRRESPGGLPPAPPHNL